MALFANMSGATKVVLAVVAVALIGMAGFAGYTYWDAKAHYVPAKAQVVWIVDNCTLERHRSGRHRRHREIGPMDCEAARLKQSQGYSGWSVQQHRHVGYTFTSPADGRPHQGAIDARPSDYPDVRPGSQIDILAHKTDPEKSRRPI